MSKVDRREQFFHAFDNAAAIVSEVEAEDLGGATPCPEWEVAALIDHLVGEAALAAELGRAPQETIEKVGAGASFAHVELSEAPGELRRQAQGARAAWADVASLIATVQMPWGATFDGYMLIDGYLTELATHIWDLAVATGRVDRLDRGLAAPALEAARASILAAYRTGGVYGPELPAPDDADDWGRLAAFMGRQPRPDLTHGAREGAAETPR